MKKNTSLVEAFTDANKELIKTRFVADPKDVYLAYCALALCTIADKMSEGCGPLFDPGKEKDAEIESGKTKL